MESCNIRWKSTNDSCNEVLLHCQGKNSKKSIQKLFIQNAEEFCLNTSLHGLKYLADKRVHPTERKFIVVSLGLIIILSGYLIADVYNNWRNNPIIVSVNPKPTFVTTLPFPAVTICDMSHGSYKKMQAFSDGSREREIFKMLCEEESNKTVAKSITNWNFLPQFIADVSVPCSKLLLKCSYAAVSFNCTEVFQSVLTDEGLCCSFNMLHPKFMFTKRHEQLFNVTYPFGYEAVDWDAEYGYPSLLPEKYIPMHTAGTGETLGLTLLLDSRVEDYHCYNSNGVGFKIFIHDPGERPNMLENGLLLTPGNEIKMRIRSEMIKSDHSLRALDWKYRHCVFQNEIKLLYFAHYTQYNCELECEAMLSWKLCGCISYFLPRVYENARICNIYNFTCVNEAHMRAILGAGNEGCQPCLPSCNELAFVPNLFSTALRTVPYRSRSIISEFPMDYVDKNIVVVKMYFRKSSYRTLKQREFIDFTSFLASVGGLMGLFLGFSLISLVECFYYGVIRMFGLLYQAILGKHSRNKSANVKMVLPYSVLQYPRDFGAIHSRRIWLSKRRPLQLQQLRERVYCKGNQTKN